MIDIVLLAPSPSAMHKLLAVCESFASGYNTVFNAIADLIFLVVTPISRRDLSRQMNDRSFSIRDQ